MPARLNAPAAAVLAAGIAAGCLVAMTPPASATGRVSIDNGSGGSAIDRSHMTTLRLRGSGFQSVKGGFGGIYVLFGAVSGNWRPSAHGSGTLLYIPDSQTRSNAGYQRFVAFPGDSTASSANGGTIAANGTWSTTIRVPGATFRVPGADGKVHTVDCAKVICGVIAIGAHGVVNARNESFTPVGIADLQAGTGTTSSAGTSSTGESTTSSNSAATTSPSNQGRARLRIDRASAGAGKVLAFTASGLPPGRQVTAVFDDGAAGVGPLTVGVDGRLAALITLPLETGPGTHQLRLVGAGWVTPVNFAVTPADATSRTSDRTTGQSVEPAASSTSSGDWRPVGFAIASGCVFLAALLFALRRGWGRRAIA